MSFEDAINIVANYYSTDKDDLIKIIEENINILQKKSISNTNNNTIDSNKIKININNINIDFRFIFFCCSTSY